MSRAIGTLRDLGAVVEQVALPTCKPSATARR